MVLAAAAALLGDSGVARAQGGPPVRVLTWPETVEMEHEDRVRRLGALALQRLGRAPRIVTYRIDRASLPASIPVDIPVSRWVFDQRVFFDTDSDVLRPEGQAVIEVVAEALRGEAADTAVFVAGHTDSRAGDAYNYDLSVRRAHSVAQSLHARKVRQAQIWEVGFGEAIPLAPNTSEAGMARNRRVEFLFGRKPEAVSTWLSRQRSLVCAGAEDVQRQVCLQAFDRLPGVFANPVARTEVSRPDRPVVAIEPPPILPRTGVRAPVVIEDRTFVPLGTRQAVALPEPSPPAAIEPPSTPRSLVEPPPKRMPVEVTITRNDPVLIDLREQRVLVETLER